MKKLSTAGCCVIIVLAIAIQPIFAQDDAMQFGVKVGLNLANLSIDPDTEGFSFDAVTKFGAGGIMLYPLSEVLDLQVEAMYLLKGTKAEFDIFGTVFELELNLAYLSVPVMVRYNLGSEDTSPYIVVGPEFGFLLSAKSKFDGEEEDIKDELKSIDLGFNVGAGVSMDMGTMPAFAEVRYSLGLSDINDDPDDDDTIKTTGIQLFVGMMF
ncbi:MAG: PorT family protein [Candidatus Marinimicrobia bacterium]|nr:PorT family protein [Candidatus Neomarinimicrobiota bacterium]